MFSADNVLPVECNPRLEALQPYPFEKLQRLLAQAPAGGGAPIIDLSVGEPRHAPPQFVEQQLRTGLARLRSYPTTRGAPGLRKSIAESLQRRFGLPEISAERQVLPTLGSREALFAFAQAVLDGGKDDGLVVCQNPFYQIYEGAALLAGLRPYFVNTVAEEAFRPDWLSVPATVWARVQLVFVCSPGNPTGRVMALEEWRVLFDLADRFGFVIASDECYSDIYFDEANPPLGALQASHLLGRRDFEQLMVFGSLSKRSNVPGLRSGFVAGDAALIAQFLRYRTYHGSAMGGLVQGISEALWRDDDHVAESRAHYAAKFSVFHDSLSHLLPFDLPDAAFYCWIRTPIDDREFAAGLYREQGVIVLPGSYLAREAHGINPGANRIRVALVGSREETREAAQRIASYVDDHLRAGDWPLTGRDSREQSMRLPRVSRAGSTNAGPSLP